MSNTPINSLAYSIELGCVLTVGSYSAGQEILLCVTDITN